MIKNTGGEGHLIEGYGNPIVYGKVTVDPALQTVLVYGHYDVQPADVADGWDQDPFELVIRDGYARARGAVDNKGQFLIHMLTVLEFFKQKKLKYNVIFFLEGDEETGSGKLEDAIKDNLEILKCDAVMISDGEIIGHDQPTLTKSFR